MYFLFLATKAGLLATNHMKNRQINNKERKQKQLLMNNKKGFDKQRKSNYFPIQNLLKIFPNKSSVVISPVISPR